MNEDTMAALRTTARRPTADNYATDDQRWRAVLRRDARADGRFYFSVRTTGVYCRPSCTARRALRRNVAFHDSCAAAERAGFRPCKRCQPGGRDLADEHAARIAAACRVIDAAEEMPSLNQLAQAASMSPFHFHRVFKKVTGLTPKAYARARRAERARQELLRRDTITEAFYESGFNSSGRFYAESTAMLGMTPGKFRAGGPGEIIRFAAGKCALGSILVAASPKGVCAISLGDQPDRLVEDLHRSFPRAKLIGGDKKFARLLARVVGFVEAPRLGLRLPLDVRGTAFQQRVWSALQKIPPGAMVSYTDLAKRIGAPRSVRAVASACAANRLAVAVPCHRVLRRDGDLSGYRWGVERKRTLLNNEKPKACC